MGTGKLIVIAGPSGVGKKTLVSKILKDRDFNIIFSVSLTTRNIREGEVNGVDYIFTTKEDFREKIERGEMLEYAEFFNNYYGTSKVWVEERLNAGKNVLLEIETIGFRQIKEKFPELLSIFILPVSFKDLELRLKNRGTEGDEAIAMRIEKGRKEVQDAHLFKYQIVNDKLEQASAELIHILEHELQGQQH